MEMHVIKMSTDTDMKVLICLTVRPKNHLDVRIKCPNFYFVWTFCPSIRIFFRTDAIVCPPGKCFRKMSEYFVWTELYVRPNSTYGHFVRFLKAFRTNGRTKSCPLTPLSCHSKSFTNVKNKIEYSLTDKITTATNSFNRVENERKIKNHTCIDITLHIISGYIHIYFSSTIHIIFFTSI